VAQTVRLQHEDARAGRISFAALGVAGLFAVLLVVLAPRHSPMAIGFVAASTGACAAVALLERRHPRLRARHVAAVIAVVFAFAVATPPRTSNDLWSYTMYGRIVSVHGASPYAKVPRDFRSDPFFARLSPVWRDRGSVFGPVWVGFSATATSVAGDSPFASRLFFQVTAALAAAAILALVWRRTRSPAALVWLGLHPVVAVAVNGGHNDLVVGLGILVAALVLASGRSAVAGVVIGLVALIKLTALLALVGIVAWLWRRRDRRHAAMAVTTAAAVVVIGYAPVLGSALHVAGGADHTVTAGSLWNTLAEMFVGHDAGRALAHPLAANTTLDALFYASIVVVAAITCYASWQFGRRSSPAPAVGAAAASYAIGAEYTQPWYAIWALPALAEREPSRLAWLVWLQAAFLLAAYKLPIHASGSPLDVTFRASLSYIAPIVFIGAFVAVSASERRRPAIVPAAPV
jgi:hypothetical protein